MSEFICFITSEASDKCKQEKRKTINGEDLLWAMSTLGFDKYVDPLKIYLAKCAFFFQRLPVLAYVLACMQPPVFRMKPRF